MVQAIRRCTHFLTKRKYRTPTAAAGLPPLDKLESDRGGIGQPFGTAAIDAGMRNSRHQGVLQAVTHRFDNAVFGRHMLACQFTGLPQCDDG